MAHRKQRRNPTGRPQSVTESIAPASASSTLLSDFSWKSRLACGWLVGMLLVWALLVPADSVSVFIGEALPQNLGWMLAAVLCSLSVIRGGLAYSKLMVSVCLVALVWLIIVAWHAGLDNNSRTGWYGFWQLMALAACYFCVSAVCVGPKSRGTLLGLAVLGCAALSMHGLQQVTFSFPQQKARYQQEPEQVLLEAGIEGPPGSAMRQRFEDRLLNSSEPFATFALANSLATLLSAGLILSISAFLALAHRSNGTPNWHDWPRWMALSIVTLFILVCWFLARSRAAYAAVVLAGIYWLTISSLTGQRLRQPTRVYAILASVAGVLLVFGFVWLLRNDELVLSEAQKSLGYRLEYWLATLGMIRDHWLLGVGLGNFQSYYPQYKLELASEIVADPHNWFLDIAATLSIPIALVILAWLICTFLPFRFLESVDVQNAEQEPPAPNDGERPNAGVMEEVDANLAKAIVWGAALGGLMCVACVWLLSSVEPAAVMAWAAAAVMGFALWPLFVQQLPKNLNAVRAATLAMLVCLLGSGSWQAPGVGTPLLVLLVSIQKQPAASTQFSLQRNGSSASLSRFLILPLVLSALGFVCFIVQAWQPVTSSWTSRLKAESTNNIERSIELAQRASQQDPLDSRLLGLIAARKVEQAVQASDALFDLRAGEAITALEEWLESDRVNATNWQRAGDSAFTLFEAARQQRRPSEKFIEQACACYSRACTQYPSSVQLHIQLATALAFTEEWQQLNAELAEALRISELTPHLDKKLESQTIWLPRSLAPDSNLSYDSDSVPAELLVNWLRTLLAESLP